MKTTRERRFAVRLTPGEHAILVAASILSAESIASFVRRAAMAEARRVTKGGRDG